MIEVHVHKILAMNDITGVLPDVESVESTVSGVLNTLFDAATDGGLFPSPFEGVGLVRAILISGASAKEFDVALVDTNGDEHLMGSFTVSGGGEFFASPWTLLPGWSVKVTSATSTSASSVGFMFVN